MIIVPMMCINHELLPHDYVYTNTFKKKPAVFCANCGGYGHVYKTCNHPIISYGIICYKPFYDSETNSIYPKYLMVQRKDSLCYVEFIRGKYSLNNKEYIMKLFTNMTILERNKIMASTFEELWNAMWCRGSSNTEEHNTKNFNKECKEATEKFNILKQGYNIKTNDGVLQHVDLAWIINNTTPLYEETEWGFPKGRRNINEEDMTCALREFREETGMFLKNIRVNKDIKPLEEVFTGSNNIRYKHVYYVARYYQYNHKHAGSLMRTSTSTSDMSDLSELKKLYDPDNYIQNKEVKDVQWFTYQEAQERIRLCNIERKELFKRLNQHIMKTFQL
jgi:8-oxo-dGTP pyrophosphatase MutT (NUDIX family)